MTDGQTDVQNLNESIETALDERGPVDKTRRVIARIVTLLGHCGFHGSAAFLSETEDTEPFCRDISAIIAEPEPVDYRKTMQAATGDEETVRGLVEEARKEGSTDPLFDCKGKILDAFDFFLEACTAADMPSGDVLSDIEFSETQQLDKAVKEALDAAYWYGVGKGAEAEVRHAGAVEAETAGPVARLNLGLLSHAKADFVHRMLDAEANRTHMIRLGYAKAVIAEVTEGTP